MTAAPPPGDRSRAEVAQEIAEMRRRGVPWKVVMRHTGYGRTRCYQLFRMVEEARERHVNGTAKSDSLGVENEECADAVLRGIAGRRR